MDQSAQGGGGLALGGTVSGEEGERLKFVLPSFPISFNKLYEVDHNRRHVRLSDAAALWKTRTIPFVKPCRWEPCLLKITLEYQSPSWFTKAGRPRRIDVQNLEKLVIDTLFAKWGYEDSWLWDVIRLKRYGEREQIYVTLERVELEAGSGSQDE